MGTGAARAHHGPDRHCSGLAGPGALARGRHPGPHAVEQLAALLAAEQLFPSPFDDLPAALGLQPPPEPSSRERLRER